MKATEPTPKKSWLFRFYFLSSLYGEKLQDNYNTRGCS